MPYTGILTSGPPTKHQKAILDKIAPHIYSKHHYHLNTFVGQLAAVVFFFVMKTSEYSTTPKGETNKKRILQKGDIKFYRKQRKLTHTTSYIHLAEKVSLTFCTHLKGTNNKTVTHWWTGKNFFPVQFCVNIITRLESYP